VARDFTGIQLSEPVFGEKADANLAKPFMGHRQRLIEVL
jgi:hypothetical protein